MAITLSTNIPQLLFSSAIPDLAIVTDTDGEVEIALSSGNTDVFTASYFPYYRKIKVFDLRSVVEMYMREQNESLMEFAVTATANEVTHQLCYFKVVYLEHRFDEDISEFLRNNFLTNTSSKMTSENALERLTLYLDANQSERLKAVPKCGTCTSTRMAQRSPRVSFTLHCLIRLYAMPSCCASAPVR